MMDHNFAHAMTAMLSWHVQNCNLIGPLLFKLELKEFVQDLNYKLINYWRNESEVKLQT